ncbi:MAG TPA: efflux RND transporter periplasmic adaptor subunit, partial [Planctomycetota bacterium]|nr:efflux RND transporter periplasmic adaptor subunit [Planctomycetota bacterium]
SGREPAPRTELEEQPRHVRVIAVPRLAVVPRALGYGVAEPGAVWRAVAEVSGKVVETSSLLEKGELVPTGTVLLRVDPAEYELAIAQAEANIMSIEAQLQELDVNEQNYRASLVIEQEALAVGQKELERKRALVESRSIAQTLYDQEERLFLVQRNKVQLLKNSLNLVPAQRLVLQALAAVQRARLSAARLDLQHTSIVVPIDGRVSQVDVEKAQFVQRGQVLAALDSVDLAEVPAQVPIGEMLKLLRADMTALPSESRAFREFLDRMSLTAVVRLRAGDVEVAWQARVLRIDSLVDPKTRTVGIIVGVDRPYERVAPGARLPLVRGMYCAVEIRGPARPDSLVVPRSALHDGEHAHVVYVVDANSRLERRPVEIDFVQSDLAVVRKGLSENDRVVVSDLVPAVPGMLLTPENDPDTLDTLRRSAAGETPLK